MISIMTEGIVRRLQQNLLLLITITLDLYSTFLTMITAVCAPQQKRRERFRLTEMRFSCGCVGGKRTKRKPPLSSFHLSLTLQNNVAVFDRENGSEYYST